MSDNPLDRFAKKYDFLIGIDSDGCAFDTMEIKHKECFIPTFIKPMGLQPVPKYARGAGQLVNLYLERLAVLADMIVCSATPQKALEKEWAEHNIHGHVAVICGQEVGGKQEILERAAKHGYAKNKVLMIGDAPGDLKAARGAGALFYPINPGHEEASWERFHKEACDRFLNGAYAGSYEDALIAEFDRYLPEQPPWQRGHSV